MPIPIRTKIKSSILLYHVQAIEIQTSAKARVVARENPHTQWLTALCVREDEGARQCYLEERPSSVRSRSSRLLLGRSIFTVVLLSVSVHRFISRGEF